MTSNAELSFCTVSISEQLTNLQQKTQLCFPYCLCFIVIFLRPVFQLQLYILISLYLSWRHKKPTNACVKLPQTSEPIGDQRIIDNDFTSIFLDPSGLFSLTTCTLAPNILQTIKQKDKSQSKELAHQYAFLVLGEKLSLSCLISLSSETRHTPAIHQVSQCLWHIDSASVSSSSTVPVPSPRSCAGITKIFVSFHPKKAQNHPTHFSEVHIAAKCLVFFVCFFFTKYWLLNAKFLLKSQCCSQMGSNKLLSRS